MSDSKSDRRVKALERRVARVEKALADAGYPCTDDEKEQPDGPEAGDGADGEGEGG